MGRLIDAGQTFELLRSLGSRDYRREKGTIMDAMKMISHPEYTPTVDAVEVVHGRWIERKEIFSENEEEVDAIGCSKCGKSQRKYRRTNYCPNCGAKMDGDGNA